jgi:hypothetical protein
LKYGVDCALRVLLFATLDSSDVGIGEEGFEEFEEVQRETSQPRQAIF